MRGQHGYVLSSQHQLGRGSFNLSLSRLAQMQIMQRVPAAVLWMYASDVAARQNLRNAMSLHGVSQKRLFFMTKVPKVRTHARARARVFVCVCVCVCVLTLILIAWLSMQSEHLTRHYAADLFLDTFHYDAHTTAADALLSGLPVLTLQGVCGSRRATSSPSYKRTQSTHPIPTPSVAREPSRSYDHPAVCVCVCVRTVVQRTCREQPSDTRRHLGQLARDAHRAALRRRRRAARVVAAAAAGAASVAVARAVPADRSASAAAHERLRHVLQSVPAATVCQRPGARAGSVYYHVPVV
jgi:hypothetical protein